MTTSNCENCGVAHGPDDMFCENCGYDFITGSLPADGDETVGPPSQAPSLLSQADAAPDGGVASEGSAGSDGPAAPAVTSEEGDPATVPDVPRITVTVAVDREFFDAVVNDGEIDFPSPVPADHELELAGNEIHIGRTSDSRAIHPDIDVADLTNDKAASSRHAVIRVAADGTCTITDVGSTNGTFLDDPESKPIEHGVPVALDKGVPVYVGAWTRIVVA